MMHPIQGLRGRIQEVNKINVVWNRQQLLCEPLEGRRLLSNTFTVTALSDEGAAGELRGAVEAANAAGGTNAINFAAGLSGTIMLSRGSLNVSGGSLSINGPGAGVLQIDLDTLASENAVLSVQTGAGLTLSGVTITNSSEDTLRNSGTLLLSNVTVSGGNGTQDLYNEGTATLNDVTLVGAVDVSFTNLGAATLSSVNIRGAVDTGLYNSGYVTLSDVSVSGVLGTPIHSVAGATASLINVRVLSNTIAGGGGVWNEGSMTLTNVRVTNNTDWTSATGGAAIRNSGNATLQGVTVSGNTLSSGNSTSAGIYNSGTANLSDVTVSNNTGTTATGGIFNDAAGNLTMSRVTISNDSTQADGGGLYNVGTATLINVTVSGNTTTGQGGGIANIGAVTLRNVTVSNNSSGVRGGGIYSSGGPEKLILANSIVAGNAAPVAGDVSGHVQSLGYNLIGRGDDISTDSGGWVASDLTGTNASPLNANLAPLADASGPTQTMLPRSGSPAINAGLNSLVPSGVTTDQRGLPRIVGGRVDMGASETQTDPSALVSSIVTAPAAGGDPLARVFNGTALAQSYLAYDIGFRSGVRVALGDLTGDGKPDEIVGTGVGAAHVKVFDGVTGQQIGGPLGSFLVYPGPGNTPQDPNSDYYRLQFRGGLFVASGDVDGDGRDDLITGADAGAGPHVKVFSGATGAEIRSFWAFDPAYGGGVRVGAADMDGDGHDDILVGSGAGASHVKVFSGATGAELRSYLVYPGPGNTPEDPNSDYYRLQFKGGVFVAGGDVDGDGRGDLITGADAGAGPHVKAISGRTGAELASFWAYDQGFGGGVHVGTGDVNGDGRWDIITGSGVGASHVKVFNVLNGNDPPVLESFIAYDEFDGGVYVAGSA